MRTLQLTLAILVAGLLVCSGCGQDDPTQPAPDAALDNPFSLDRGAPPQNAGPIPGYYYSMFYLEETGNYSEFSRIDTKGAPAEFLWRLQFPFGGDGVNSFGWFPFGFAFDVDGTMYMTHNIIAFDPGLVRSQFARVDSETGEVFPIGDTVPFNTSGGDIDACGNFYVCGFQVDALGYIFGNDSLWRVDKVTGEFTEVGPTGHTNWMDLAFDEDGTLWGTFDNELYTIDTETGASTYVSHIQNVPDAGDPNLMEIMSIAFDKHNVLYGTGLTVYYLDPRGSPVMRIDPWSGETELLGYSMTPDYNHGGDIMPSSVRIAHRTRTGEYVCKTVSMRALDAHLAHGDYVPGAAGTDCACPGQEMQAVE